MRKYCFLPAVMLLASTSLSHAQPVSGLYIGAGAGGTVLQDRNLGVNGSHVNLRSDTGWTGNTSVGYGFGNGIRSEIEGYYRQNSLHRTTGLPFPTASGGDTNNYGVMVNALYDFGVSFYGVQPYAGVGVGWQHSELSNVRVAAPGFLLRGNNGHDDPAFQGIVGVSYPLDSVPGLSLTAEYRVRGAFPDSSSYRTQVFSGSTAGSAKLHSDTELNHNVLVGFRYAFNAAPAAVTVGETVPAPAASTLSRSYLVFFDWDRADMTDRARQIVAEASAASMRMAMTRIEVSGHADASGTAAYNRGLSERRANAVTAELVRHGVPRDSISVHGYGDTRPLVPTAAGVREPQNRRVEIVMR